MLEGLRRPILKKVILLEVTNRQAHTTDSNIWKLDALWWWIHNHLSMSCNTLAVSSYVEILSELFLRIQQHPSELEEKFDFIRKYCSLVARLFMVLCANMTLYGTLSLLLLDKNVCQTILSTIFFQQPTLRLHCFLVHLMRRK